MGMWSSARRRGSVNPAPILEHKTAGICTYEETRPFLQLVCSRSRESLPCLP